jgi:hypothetical protein
VVGRCFERELCPEEIDVVYTWVNGSDPRHVEGTENANVHVLSRGASVPQMFLSCHGSALIEHSAKQFQAILGFVFFK